MSNFSREFHMKYISILWLLLFNVNVRAEQYHFVAIEHLIEQEIGAYVLPKIYQELDLDISISPVPGNRAQQLASSGAKDGEIMRIFSYGIEHPTTLRVPTPYYYLETMAFIKEGSNITIDSSEDLKNYSIAKVRGVKHTNNITQGLPHVYDLSSTENIMRLVSQGRVDIALTNSIDGKIALQELKITNVVPLKKPLATLDLFHYLHQEHQALIPIVDAKIIELKNNGKLTSLITIAEQDVINNHLTRQKND